MKYQDSRIKQDKFENSKSKSLPFVSRNVFNVQTIIFYSLFFIIKHLRQRRNANDYG